MWMELGLLGIVGLIPVIAVIAVFETAQRRRGRDLKSSAIRAQTFPMRSTIRSTLVSRLTVRGLTFVTRFDWNACTMSLVMSQSRMPKEAQTSSPESGKFF